MISDPALVVVFIAAHTATLLATVMLHEFGHYAVSRALGGQPELYHVYVRHKSLTPPRRAIVAAAGPFTSLFQGAFCLGMLSLFQPGLTYLMLLWLALLGFANFFGYLITTAYWDDGDFGKIARLLGWPRWLRVGLSGVGFLTMPVLSMLAARGFSALSLTLGLGSKTGVYLVVILLPWLAGSLYFAVLARPAPIRHVLPYPLFSGLYLVAILPMLPPSPGPVFETPSTWVIASLLALALTTLLFVRLRNKAAQKA